MLDMRGIDVPDIFEGREYVYTGGIPAEATGHHYKVHRFVLDVPSYQQKVLVEALTGKDKGLWFTCTVANFRVRYQLVKPEPTLTPGAA